VGLGGFGDYLPSELSGGMRQRAALARALVSRTDLLLLDEPFGSLDAQSREEMQELVARVHALLRPTVLTITHDIEEAVFLADRVVVLSSLPGRIRDVVAVPAPRPRTVAERETPEACALRGRLRRLLRDFSDCECRCHC
jgi:NitT/TauT family transport system ATP-binding protein